MTNMKQEKKPGFRKIIWAVDAYADKRLQSSAAKLLQIVSRDLPCSIEPVYVLAPPPGFPAVDDEERDAAAEIRRAEDALKRKLAEYPFLKLSRFKILAQKSRSLRGEARALLAYAASKRADAILLSTNARSGFSRMFMGSFAETVALQSNIPIFIVSPNAKIAGSLSPILFPTDFSDPSWKAFQSVVKIAAKTNSKVIVFHQCENRSSSIPRNVLKQKGARWEQAGPDFSANSRQASGRSAERWRDWAVSKNVRCDVLFQFGTRNVADATLSAARKVRAKMIAMASIKGPNELSLLGSVPRLIIRKASCPIWVLHVPPEK